ncbi:class I SAM-dependent methyltransferase [Dongia soli]|uniref:Class I SAM-dependent methyltransferase n=1 Tax=Dongia soli TaxID=600628 RepID=A0ABU5EIJ0_9PROT|nr:class I SAM-dependent methyltransferase [Dongia soli]MDY0885639.1 class I SAM-dependent methyltransferase [Dongia soli]
MPVGTGRFIPAYAALRLKATGMDISPDMTAIAARKAEKLGLDMPLLIGDIRHIDAKADSFDIGVCICFLNWVDTAGAREALKELVRVTGGHLIVGIRHYTPLEELSFLKLQELGQFFLQIAVRIYKAFTQTGLRVHEKSAIHRIFREKNLRTVEQVRVVPRKYGTDYYIYMLEKPRRGAYPGEEAEPME